MYRKQKYPFLTLKRFKLSGYIITEKIRIGTQAVIYSTYHKQHSNRVIKLFFHELSFLREVKALKTIGNH